MPIANYPAVTTIVPLVKYEREPEYAVTVSPPFADGGRDFNLDADEKIRRFVLKYAGHEEADIAALDAHADAAKLSPQGSAYDFTFTTWTGEVIAGVRYLKYERHEHAGTWNQSRTVELVKYP